MSAYWGVMKYIKLREYLSALEEKELLIASEVDLSLIDRDIEHITFDSRDVEKNSIFIVKGAHFKQEYIEMAIERGAVAVVLEEHEFDVFEGKAVWVENISETMATLGEIFYDKPWEKLDLIGVTGTKGKSTTTYMIKSILNEFLYPRKTALISGIANYCGGEEIKSHLTTPENLDIYKHLDSSIENGIGHCIIEVSSQALKYGRTRGLVFDIGCFLNIGEDHLGGVEHTDIEDYFQSKKLLMNFSKTACINLDFDGAEEVLEAAIASSICKEVITFSTKNDTAEVFAYDITGTNEGLIFKVRTNDFDEEFKISMKGKFNISNAICAISVCHKLNIPIENIKRGLVMAKAEGRMEILKNEAEGKFGIVDYAHNEMSFEALFDFVNEEYPGYKVFTVFGCSGSRGFSRRVSLPKIISRRGDKCFVTEIDPTDEPLEKICSEVSLVLDELKADYEVIYNPDEAIRQAFREADKKTVVLVTGGILNTERIILENY